MILQTPVPPMPPLPPSAQFDPNLIFMNEGGPPIVLLIVIAALLATVVILWPIMRALARRLEGRPTGDVELRGEVEQMQHRLGEVDGLQTRVSELEERLDFAERLLSQAQQPARLGASPTEPS